MAEPTNETTVTDLIQRVRELDKAATPGPWAVDDSPYSDYTWGPKMEMLSDACPHCASYRLRGHGGRLPQKDNAVFIAESRTLVVQLADAAERLQAEKAGSERVLTAPWSQEVINELNAHQGGDSRHPYTCGRLSCRRDHPDAILRATSDGWRCDHCDYEQNWAHWQAAYSAVPNLELSRLRARVAELEGQIAQMNKASQDGGKG